MTQIADLAGLQAPSVYHYFQGKRAILLELALNANRAPLKVISALNGHFDDGEPPLDIDGSPTSKLWAFLVCDVLALQKLPFDINEVHRFVAEDAESEQLYRQTRNKLTTGVHKLVSEGIDAGEIRSVDARWVSLILLSHDEGIQNWIHEVDASNPQSVSEFMADIAIRGLMVDPSNIDKATRSGRHISEQIQSHLVKFP